MLPLTYGYQIANKKVGEGLKKTPLSRVLKPQKIENNNDKLGVVAGNNIAYNYGNRIRTSASKKLSEDNIFNTGNKNNDAISNLNELKFGDRDKDKMINKHSKNLVDNISISSNNAQNEIMLKHFREEIVYLKTRLAEKDKVVKDLQLKNHNLESENKFLKLKNTKSISRDREIMPSSKTIIKKSNQDDEDLALVIEKINEMERRENQIESHNHRHHEMLSNPFGINNIHPSDIININSNDPFFAHMINQLNTYEEIDPMHEYDDHILNDLCPNPDNMTYEQLLELQDQVGHVDKGFTKLQIGKNMKNIDKCTVCQFDFNDNENLRKLTCGHLYHKLCVDEWLLQDKKCPVCKSEVDLR